VRNQGTRGPAVRDDDSANLTGLVNPADDTSAPPSGAMSRRGLLTRAGGAVGLLLVGSAGSTTGALAHVLTQPVTGTQLPTFSGATWVGETATPGLLIAIIVTEPTLGEGPREARAYLCDRVYTEWFIGTIENDLLELSSDLGGRLSGQLSGDVVAGSVSPSGGNPLSFQAGRATGSDGLYTITMEPDGSVHGTSSSGAIVEGQVRSTGRIVLPTGEVIEMDGPVLFGTALDIRTILFGEQQAGILDPIAKKPGATTTTR
jgi:hypothetical protein